MKLSKFSEEQIAYALRQADAGTPVGDVCRQLGVSEATFYAWKKKYAHLGVNELRRLRQLDVAPRGIGAARRAISPDSRSRPRPAALRVPAPLGPAPAGRLARESQA